MIGLGLGLGIGVASGGLPAWSPAALSGHVAWFRADLGTNTTVDGDTITSWADQYGVQGAFSSGAGTPKYKAASPLNSQPSIQFAGTDRLDSVSSASWQLPGAYSIWIIGEFTTLTTFNTILSKGNGVADGWDIYTNSSAIHSVQGGAGAVSSADGTRLGNATPWAIQIDWNGTTVSWHVDGTSLGSASAGAPASNSTPVSIGQRADAGTTFTGHINEIIATSAVIAGADLASLKAYLSARYALTIV